MFRAHWRSHSLLALALRGDLVPVHFGIEIRLLAALVMAVGLMVGPAAAAHRSSVRPLLLQTTTGRITALDLSQVTVGRMTCSLTVKTAVQAGTFAVGENVSIGCLGKALKTIKLAPITNGHALLPISITVPSSLSASNSSAAKPSVVTSSASAQGAITALTPTSITIGDVTCPFHPPTAQFQVGQVIQMNCKTYADGISVGSILISGSAHPG